jgi:hypothetical protein
MRNAFSVFGVPLPALPGGEAAGQAKDELEIEGNCDEEDATQWKWCTGGGKSFRRKRTHGAKRDEKAGSVVKDCVVAKFLAMTGKKEKFQAPKPKFQTINEF